MFVNEIPFLVNVLTPLNFTFVDRLQSRSANMIFKILWKQLSHCMKNGFKVKTVRCDPEAGLVALDPKLAENGINLDIAGQEEAVPVAESKIRRIKERARGIINTLPFKIPLKFIAFLIFFCTSRLNMTCNVGDMSGISPWEKYYGRKIDFKKNLKASFGDYVQASRNKVDNTMATRTDGALALYDTGNLEGTWWLYNLRTDKVIRRFF